MGLKRRTRFTIHDANKMYVKGEKAGFYTYGESIRNRAFMDRLSRHRRKKKVK